MFSFGFCYTAKAQVDPVQYLDEIVLSDSKLKNYASGVKVEKLNDSVISKNAKSLTGLLTFNSSIYFKENGYGMVSSPSFRGTTASQTAVIWNGININSQLNGQTDFNTLNTINYNSIDIRSGGGSVQYGSGAIGGSIHLNNTLKFNRHFFNNARLSYGSFNTKNGSYLSSYSNGKFSGNLGVAYAESDNDYKYLGTNKTNENGAFNNLNLSLNLGYFISQKDILKLYHHSYKGHRDFSSTLVTPSRNSYKDDNHRTMVSWAHISGAFKSDFKTAFLQENFKYFENKDKDNYTFGKVNTVLFNHNLNIRLSQKFQLKTILEYTNFNGDGSSFGDPKRDTFSATALLNHKPTESFSYGINIRKDFTSEFESPFVFSADAKYRIGQHYSIQINGSKNYRVPTFNDLYWQPGGNIDLIPESSYQLDFGQQFDFKKVSIKLNGYYINTKDFIQWVPDNTALWRPQNIAEVESYGAELELNTHYNIGKHQFSLTGHYSYTVSENVDTKKQLIYVPYHKGNFNLAYSYKSFSMFYQHMFNGEVFTTEDNLHGRFYALDAYDLANLGCFYKILNTDCNMLELGLNINNIFNEVYQNVALRPMPNRNFNIQIHYEF